mgnify:CR=1 FL=1
MTLRRVTGSAGAAGDAPVEGVEVEVEVSEEESEATRAAETAMRSLRTLPAPTLGSWSVSPTRRRWARADAGSR